MKKYVFINDTNRQVQRQQRQRANHRVIAAERGLRNKYKGKNI